MSKGTRTAALVMVGTLVLGAPAAPPAAETTRAADEGRAERTRVRGEVYALLMRALMAQRRGEYKSAAADIRRAVELQPEDPAVLIQGAELLELMGRLRDAEEYARKALEIDPDSTEALWFVAERAAALALGTTKPDPKHRDEALRLLARLEELGVEDPELQRKVVSLRLQAGDQAGALEAARQLVAKRPGDRHAVGMLGQLLLDTGEPEQALRVLVRFIADHPNDSALIRLAEELARDLNAWDVVEETFADSDGFEDRAVEAQRLRGEALLRLEQIEPASRALEKVLLADPSDRSVRYHLSRTYRRMGRLGEAAELARGLAEELPADRGAHLLLAETLDDQGDVEGALNAYNTVLRLFTTDEASGEAQQIREAIRRRMALLYLVNHQPAAAGRLLDEMEVADDPETLQVRARLAIDASDWTSARQYVRKLRTAEDAVAANMLEAEIYLRTNKPARALPKIELAVSEAGNPLRVRAAAVYLDVDLAEKGEELLREWVEQEPDNPVARFQLGTFLYQADRLDDAELALREVFRLEPDNAQALNFLGYSFAERGVKLDEALEMIQRALALDAWNGAYLDSLGWVYYQMGSYDDAREPLEQAARTYPHDPTVLEHLGDLYEKMGERDLAIAAWSRAIDAGSDDPDALTTKIEVIEVAEQEEKAGGQTAKPRPAEDPMPWTDPSRWP